MPSARVFSAIAVASTLVAGAATAGCTTAEPAPVTVVAAAPLADPPAAEAGFPSAATTGVPTGTVLTLWRGGDRLGGGDSRATGTTIVDGIACDVYDGFRFELEGDRQMRVVGPCVVVRNSWFSSTSDVSALLTQTESSGLLVVERSTFDGGPFHVRGVQGDFADLRVSDSAFFRFGNAAIEMNDRSATATLTVEGCYLFETTGWPRDQHVDGVQMDAGGAVVVRNTTILITPFGDPGGAEDYDYVSNSAIGVGATLGDIGTVLLEGNLLAGGGRLIYLQQKDYRFTGDVTVLDNVFDQRWYPAGAIWGPLHPDGLPEGLVWEGNRLGDGTPVDLAGALALSP